MSGSNNTGIYAGQGNNFDYFTYTYNDTSSTMNSSVLFSLQAYSWGSTFSADNRRLILLLSNNITLYINCLFQNCAIYNASCYCFTCISGYYPSDLNCSYQCNRTCLTCSNSSACDTCISSSPSRTLSLFCACPNTTFDDGSNAQCQNCSQLCSTCTNSTQCSTCIGSVYANSSRLLPNCSCPINGYFDAYPNYTECQACLPQCYSCTNNISCISCAGNTTWNYSRAAPQCNCPPGSFSNLTQQINCIVCLPQCATCTNSTYCHSCIGVQGAKNSRLQNQFCSCPVYSYYNSLPEQQDCQPCSFDACQTCTNSSTCSTCIGDQSQNYSRILPNCSCPAGFYSNTTNQSNCIACQQKCVNCTNATNCLSCIGSQNSSNQRTLNQSCACPVNFYFDSFPNPTDCQTCSYPTCLTCTNSTQCLTCIGSVYANSSRLLPNCSCAINGYFDTYPNYTECQACLPQCYNCTNNSSCISCAGNTTWNYSRAAPQCNCPPGSFSNLTQQLDCIICPPQCATCTNSTYCLSCIGVQAANNSRLQNQFCSCPARYYSNLSISSDCLRNVFTQYLNNLQTACPPECASCTDYTSCTSCVGNQDSISSRLYQIQCGCPDSYFSDLTLSLDCIAQPLYPSTCCAASCYANFYFNTSQQSCLPCDESCLTCSLSSTNCTSCNTAKNQQLFNFQCVCKPGYTITFNNSCIPILQTASLPCNIPLIQSYIDQEDSFPIINITFPVPMQQQFYADNIAQNIQVQIAKLTFQQDYFYNITATTVNYITLNFYFTQSIGYVIILIFFPNNTILDIYNRIIPLASINYPFGPYLILQSELQKQQIQNIQNSANSVLDNQFVEFLRAISFFAYFLISVQMTFSLLLINTVYPQNFYEVLRLLCATYISTIPPYNELNAQYSYKILYIPVNTQVQTSLPSLQLYRLGFSGQLILDSNHQIMELIFIWSIFQFVVKKLHTKYKDQIEKGEKKFIDSVYIFTFQTIVKIHEAIIGITFYSLLLQFSCMTFQNTLGIISFLISIVLTAYILVISIWVWSVISNQNTQVSWICEYFEPLVARQGLNNRNLNQKNYNLIKYFQLYSYFKKSLVMYLIFFGSGSGNFQLISVLVVYAINLLFIMYINPYKSCIQMMIKLLAEISMIILLVILLIATNKLQDFMKENVLNADDVNYVNSLGWAAAWILCTFNVLCLLIVLMDYFFDLIDYLQKRKLARSQSKNIAYNNINNNNQQISFQNPIQQQSVNIELVQAQKQNVNVQDCQDQNNNQINESNKKTNKMFRNKRSYNLNQINDPKSMSLLRNLEGQPKPQKLSLNQSHVKFIKYSEFFTINLYNKYIENKNYLIEYTNYFQDQLKCTVLSYEIINEKFLEDIEKLKKIDKKIKNNLICVNSQINQNLSMQVSKLIQQLQEIVYGWRIQPDEIVIKWKDLAYQNYQAVQLLKMQRGPVFQNLVQFYGPQLMQKFKKQMLVIENGLNHFLNATSNQERIQQGYNLCIICQNILIQIKITIFYLLISTQQLEQIFFESFEAIDPFYQENSQFPVRLARRVQNELLHLTQQCSQFAKTLNFISSYIHYQKQYEDQLLSLNDIIQNALQIFINIGGIKVGSIAQDKVERLLRIRSNDVKQAVMLIRNEIDKKS